MGSNNIIRLFSFIQMLYGGLIIGLCYDIVDFIFYAVAKKRHLSDIVFWICTLIISATVFFYAADLTLRLYLLTGLIVGWGVYFVFVSFLVQLIFQALVAIIEKTAKMIFKPFKAIYKSSTKRYEHEILFVKRNAKKIINLPKSTKMIYNKYSKYFFGKGKKEDEQNNKGEKR